MDSKITVCVLTFAVSAFLGTSVLALVAVEALPLRYNGLGVMGLAVAVSLYLRRHINRLVVQREHAAFNLGRASIDLERNGIHSVQ